jgi:hypothetical protein
MGSISTTQLAITIEFSTSWLASSSVQVATKPSPPHPSRPGVEGLEDSKGQAHFLPHVGEDDLSRLSRHPIQKNGGSGHRGQVIGVKVYHRVLDHGLQGS